MNEFESETSIDDIEVPETIDGIVSTSAYNALGAVPGDSYYWRTGTSTVRMTNYLLIAIVCILILMFSFRGKKS